MLQRNAADISVVNLGVEVEFKNQEHDCAPNRQISCCLRTSDVNAL